jgi:hypothetical protein
MNHFAKQCIVMCGLPGSTIFLNIISQMARFLEKSLLQIKCVFLFCLQICLKHFSLWEEFSEVLSSMYIGVRVKYRYSCQVVVKLEFSRQIFERSWNIKFRENPHSGSRVVRCGRTDMKLIIAFRNFANAPKNPLMLFREIIVIGCMTVMEEKWALPQNVTTDFKESWQLLTLIGSGQSNTFFPLPVVVIGRTITNRSIWMTKNYEALYKYK